MYNIVMHDKAHCHNSVPFNPPIMVLIDNQCADLLLVFNKVVFQLQFLFFHSLVISMYVCMYVGGVSTSI